MKTQEDVELPVIQVSLSLFFSVLHSCLESHRTGRLVRVLGSTYGAGWEDGAIFWSRFTHWFGCRSPLHFSVVEYSVGFPSGSCQMYHRFLQTTSVGRLSIQFSGFSNSLTPIQFMGESKLTLVTFILLFCFGFLEKLKNHTAIVSWDNLDNSSCESHFRFYCIVISLYELSCIEPIWVRVQ